MNFQLTNDNYFSPNRPHISNSMISDYLKDPAFYKKKYVQRIIPKNTTDSMKRGSVVDSFLTRGICLYQKKVLKKDDPELFELQKDMPEELLVSEKYWEQAKEIATYVKSQPFWQENLASAEFQVVLEGIREGLQVCGLPDRVDELQDGSYRMIDLKVVSPIKITSPMKWLLNADEMGYIRQAALYRDLFAEMRDVPKEKIQFYHAAAAYEEEGLVRTALFHIPEELIKKAEEEIKTALQGIKKRKFDSKPVEWSNVQELPKVVSNPFDTTMTEEEANEELRPE